MFSVASAQPVLTFEINALKADVNNPMSYCVYKDAGLSGANVTWDFSDLEFVRSFTGFLKNSRTTEIGSTFQESNTELAEFDSRFYFKVNDNKIAQYGYSSANGRVQIRYDVPFIKMKYPFSYGDQFYGTFSGNTYYSRKIGGEMMGTYTVEADAYGTLHLPGNTVYDNTLRVRTEKNYTHTINSTSQEVRIITYRWYNEAHRYPLLVLTEYTVKSGNSVTIKYQAAYNNNAMNYIPPVLTESILLYPNPTSSSLALEYNAMSAGTLNISISDANGKVVRIFDEHISTGGIHYSDLSDKITDLKAGTYYFTIQNGKELINKIITLVD